MPKKPNPKPGMMVTWIDSKKRPQDRLFIKETLIRKYGKKGIKVLAVELTGIERQRVFLFKNGKPIMSSVNPDHLSSFDWGWLRLV
jgi:hypothetical protein